MTNKVKFGLEQLHIAFIDEEQSTDIAPVYEKPIHIPGVVGFSVSPEGNENSFYADNTLYWHYESNNGYSGELEMALVPDEILAEMLGHTIDSNGMIVESTEDKPREFALMGQIQGDKKNRRFVYYRVKAGRFGQESSTATETIVPSTDVLSLTIMPVEAFGKKIVRGVIEPDETNQAVYEAFFDEVILPDAQIEQ